MPGIEPQGWHAGVARALATLAQERHDLGHDVVVGRIASASSAESPGGAWRRSPRPIHRRRSTRVLDTSLRTVAPARDRGARHHLLLRVDRDRSATRPVLRRRSSTRVTSSSAGDVDCARGAWTPRPRRRCRSPRRSAHGPARPRRSCASVRESGKNESGVTFTMPMTLRAQRHEDRR